MTSPSDRPPPYIPRWGQDPDRAEERRPGPEHDPFGSDPPADEWGSLRSEPARPSPRLSDAGVSEEAPHQRARPHGRPRSRLGKVLRYSFTFGLAAALTLALVYLLVQGPGSRDAQPVQHAGSGFTTRFKGEDDAPARAGTTLANADSAAAGATRSPGSATRTPSTETPAASPGSQSVAAAPVRNPAPTRAAPAPPQQPADTRPPAPPARVLGRDEIEFLLSQGDAFVSVGDFASARVVFRRAAEARDARAALALGATYDPILLARMGARGIAPDAAMAREWYNRARDYGSREAADRLQALANMR